MGCGGEREKGPPDQSQKWDFITLSDFKSTSSWNSLAYMWLWTMALVSVLVYTADTYTAINLLAFNKWTAKVQPALDIKYSRWIFAGCILFSWALAIIEWIRAIRVIRRGGVAESYMDPLAVSLQSMRSQGWRRFLVFSALTKSKKGADYVAFFVYFAFKGAVRVIIAEGPRQVINGMTLYAIMKADFFGKVADDHSAIEQFWLNLQSLFDTNKVQAMTIVTMLFTLIIWVISALSLLAALILYIVFLSHYIPQSDGRLSIYCRRKIDKRLARIVESKVKAAIDEEERIKRKAEVKAEVKMQKTGQLPPLMAPKLVRQPTIPQIGPTPEMKSDEKLPEFPLSRHDTSTTIATPPPYSSRPPTRNEQRLERQPTLPDTMPRRPAPSRTGTQASAWSNMSYESDAPLLANAGYAGETDQDLPPLPPSRPGTAFSRQDSNASFNRPMPARTMTHDSQFSQRSNTPMSRAGTPGAPGYPPPMARMGSSQSRVPVGPRIPVRTNTGMSFEQGPLSTIPSMGSASDLYGGSQAPASRQNTPGPMARQDSQASFHSGPPPMLRQNPPGPMRQDSLASFHSGPPPMSRQPTFSSLHSRQGSFSRPMPPPALRQPSPATFAQPLQTSPESYEMTPQPPMPSQIPAPAGGYVAFNPGLRSDSATPASLVPAPQRSVTLSGDPGVEGSYFGHVASQVPQRSATAPIEDHRATIGYSDIVEDYRASDVPSPPHRAATGGPQEQSWTPRF